jgi:hypothetical protein
VAVCARGGSGKALHWGRTRVHSGRLASLARAAHVTAATDVTPSSGMTRSCPVPRRRPRLSWAMRVWRRSRWSRRGCTPWCRWGPARARGNCARDSIPESLALVRRRFRRPVRHSHRRGGSLALRANPRSPASSTATPGDRSGNQRRIWQFSSSPHHGSGRQRRRQARASISRVVRPARRRRLRVVS